MLKRLPDTGHVWSKLCFEIRKSKFSIAVLLAISKWQQSLLPQKYKYGEFKNTSHFKFETNQYVR